MLYLIVADIAIIMQIRIDSFVIASEFILISFTYFLQKLQCSCLKRTKRELDKINKWRKRRISTGGKHVSAQLDCLVSDIY